MLVYQMALAAVVLLAYPRVERIDLSLNSTDTQLLVDFFFLGQFVIASLMAPSFAAGAISGEKERKTYEMLLASPITPGSIVIGKLIAALTHLVVLMIGSLPIIMLCLPLGGVAIQELLAAYLGLLAAIFLFGAISVACSSYFKRTSASVVVSYAIILPMVVIGCVFWRALADQGLTRLVFTTTILPATSLIVGGLLLFQTSRRLLYPPDVGSGGNEVTDIENEQNNAVGLVIQRDQFPDSLFAPPRRKTLLSDKANPVYDKEIHAELFSQGTLMLRLVIQLSMILAIPLMGFLLFYAPNYAAWYIGYVIVFNVLVAPVFTAGSICSERERQTLDLLLTTTITPWQILWGKLLAGFRVSFVLTMFLMWPVILSFVLNPELARNWPAMLTYFAIVVVTSFFNSLIALFLLDAFHQIERIDDGQLYGPAHAISIAYRHVLFSFDTHVLRISRSRQDASMDWRDQSTVDARQRTDDRSSLRIRYGRSQGRILDFGPIVFHDYFRIDRSSERRRHVSLPRSLANRWQKLSYDINLIRFIDTSRFSPPWNLRALGVSPLFLGRSLVRSIFAAI